MVNRMSVGERISELRKQNQMSQLQLAQALEISRQAVSKWESGQSTPDTVHLIKLAEILDTDVEYLSTGRMSMGRRPPVVINTVETVEKVVQMPVLVEKPVETIVEKPRIQYIEKPVIQYVDRPVIKKVVRTKYLRDPWEFAITGIVCFLLGIAVGLLI